jgi:H+-transporting ATPase
VLIFMTLSILIFQDYPLTAVMIILLALLNDLPIMMISVDNVPMSKKPVRWQMKDVMSTALLLGFISVGFSFILYWFAYQWASPAGEMAPWLVEMIGVDTLAHWKTILPPLIDATGKVSPADNPIGTLMFLKLAVAGHMTLYMARTGKSCFAARPWPAWKLLVVCEGTQLLGLMLGVYGIFMPALGWEWAIFLIVFALVELLITDFIKVAVVRAMSLEGGKKMQKHFARVTRKVHAFSHP